MCLFAYTKKLLRLYILLQRLYILLQFLHTATALTLNAYALPLFFREWYLIIG
jgi:hypothetical protein